MFFGKTKYLRQCNFVIGYDTYIRLVDLKYYGHDLKVLLTCLEEQATLGTKYTVAGRKIANQFVSYDDIPFQTLVHQ